MNQKYIFILKEKLKHTAAHKSSLLIYIIYNYIIYRFVYATLQRLYVSVTSMFQHTNTIQHNSTITKDYFDIASIAIPFEFSRFGSLPSVNSVLMQCFNTHKPIRNAPTKEKHSKKQKEVNFGRNTQMGRRKTRFLIK